MLFVFGRPNVHMKKRKLIYESKKFKLRFLASCRLFSRFARFRWGRCHFNQSKRCISILFPLQYITSQWQNALNNKVRRGHLFGGRFAWSQINVLRIVLFLFLCQGKICSRSPDKNKSTYNQKSSFFEHWTVTVRHGQKIGGRFDFDSDFDRVSDISEVFLLWFFWWSSEGLLRHFISKGDS